MYGLSSAGSDTLGGSCGCFQGTSAGREERWMNVEIRTHHIEHRSLSRASSPAFSDMVQRVFKERTYAMFSRCCFWGKIIIAGERPYR